MAPDRFASPGTGNARGQRDLARVLLASYGYDEAVSMSQENRWEGVLRALLPVRRPQVTPAARSSEALFAR